MGSLSPSSRPVQILSIYGNQTLGRKAGHSNQTTPLPSVIRPAIIREPEGSSQLDSPEAGIEAEFGV